MNNLKGRHGVTRRHGITDNTLAYFTYALLACVPIMEAIEELSGVRTESSEQDAQHHDHRDVRPARQKRDVDNRMAFVDWHHTTRSQPSSTKTTECILSYRVCLTVCGRYHQLRASTCHWQHPTREDVGHNFGDITMKRGGNVQPLAA